MLEPSTRKTSAALHFDLVDANYTVFMRVGGEPNDVRKALRAACSHRRSIVVARGNEYFVNCLSNLSRLALDSVRLYPDKEAYRYEHLAYQWNYRIDLLGARQTPYIHYHSQGKDETHCPLFQFLGTEQKRPYEFTEKRLQNKGGRPREHWLQNDMYKRIENLTPAQRQRYERLAKARKAKERGKAAQQQALTVKAGVANRLPLDLKNKPRKIHVDFTGTPSIEKHKGETIAVFERGVIDDQVDYGHTLPDEEYDPHTANLGDENQ